METNKGKNIFVLNAGLSKELSNFEEAVKYYNWNADNDYVGSKPLKDRAEYGETATRHKLRKNTWQTLDNVL